MPPAQRNSRQNQFTNRMPGPAKRVILARIPDAHAHTTVRRNDLENDVEGAERDGLRGVMVRFGDGNEEDC